jgi:hypothetical protein
MGTDYRRNLPNNAYQAATTANDPSQQNPYATIADLGTGAGGDTLLISGGASYSGTGLDFDVSILVFKIAGIEYTTSAETTVTLAVGDPTFARFDAIIATLDASDNPIVDVVQGTPSATPVTPALSADQVLVQYVDIQATATTPNITTVQVYREDQTSDWLGSVFGGFGNAAVFSSPTPAPTEGLFCCLNTVGRYGLNRGTRFTAPTAVDRSQYAQLSFRIYLVDDFVANYVNYIRVFGYSALPTDEGGTGEYLGLIDVIPYMDLTAVGQWQLVTVPTGLMDQNLSVSEIGFLNFTVYNCPPALVQCGGTALKDNSGNLITLQYAIDDVKLQTGVIPNPQVPTITIEENSVGVGTTDKLDFQDGNNTTVEVTENLIDDKIEVKYNVTSSYFGTVNGRTIVEVTQESDFGVGGILLPNTTYVVRGEVAITSTLQASSADGVEIVGLGRDTDGLNVTAVGITMFNITDSNVIFKDLKFRGTGANSTVLRATNISAGLYNDGRLKTLAINDCQFRNCQNVMVIRGFDLVDINNCLFNYVEAPTSGLDFEDVSKLQITSCELIRWFDESTIPTPSGWATAAMINLLPNNVVGFGAVNINGCVIHPQQTQIGINISALSTTGFGTISSNAFVPGPFTGAGSVFEPTLLGLPDYSATQALKYDVFANQGILNSTSGCVGTLSGNATATNTAAGIQDVNTGGGALTQAAVRFAVDTAGIATYNGTKQIYCSIHASVTVDSTGNDGTYELSLWKNVGGGAYSLLPGSEQQIEFDSAGALTLNVGSVAINYGTLFNNGDQLKIRIEKISAPAQDCTVVDFQLVIRE